MHRGRRGPGRDEEVIAVLTFDPFRELERASELLGASPGTSRAPRFMPVDLYRSGDHYVLHADLPGVDPGSVDVSVEGGTLTITAERTARGEEGVQWIGAERPSGTFRRRLTLGEDVAADAITATFTDGVLSVTMPVAERAKPRRVAVERADRTRSVEAHAVDRELSS